MKDTPKIDACHHIGLKVTSFDDARNFYTNVLHLTDAMESIIQNF